MINPKSLQLECHKLHIHQLGLSDENVLISTQPECDAIFVKKTELHFHISTKTDSAWLLPQAWGCLGDNVNTCTGGGNGRCLLLFFPFRVGTCNMPCYTAKPFLILNSLNTTCPRGGYIFNWRHVHYSMQKTIIYHKIS